MSYLLFNNSPFRALSLTLLLALSLTLAAQCQAELHIDSPSNGQTVGGVVPVTISWYVKLSSLYCTYRYDLGGASYVYPIGYYLISPASSAGSHSFNWDTSGVPNSIPVTITVTTLEGYKDSISLAMVYNPAPAIAFTTPADGAYILPTQNLLTATIAFHNLSPNFHGINYASVQLSGNGIYPVTRYYYSPSPQTSGTFSADFTMSSYPLGVYTFRGYCTDDSGKSNTATIHITKGYPPLTNIDPKKQNPQPFVVGEPINVASGNMSSSHTDISIPARELPLELSRTYNSQGDFSGQFGYGFRSNFDITLKEYPDASVVEVDEKGVYTIYSKNTDGTYKPSAGKYSTLTKNPDGTFTLLRKHGNRLYFDTQGRLIKIAARNGNAINILRDSNGAILEVSDPSNRKLLFSNDSQGRVTQITDPAARTFKYEYDANGNLIKLTEPGNNLSTYQYNSNHKLTLETDPLGNTINFEYDSEGRAYHSWQEANNNEVSLSFDTANSRTTVTDSRGNPTTYEYNTYGLVTKITDTQGNTQTTLWDGNMNKLSFTDQNSHTTTYAYDSRGNLLSTIDPQGNTTTFTYEPGLDFIKTITDTQANLTTYDYDAKGNLTKVTDALGYSTTNTYDSLGQLQTTTNPKNSNTSFSYDQYGNLATTTDALGNTTSFTYDILGNRTQTKDALNNTTQFTYNELNQLTQVTYPDNSLNTLAYDALGNKLSSTDNAGNTTYYTYDLNNRLLSSTNPLGKTVLFVYDTEGNRTKVIDQNKNETIYQYDSTNRLISETNPLGLTKSYTYDPAGNRISLTDARANTITYEYDSLNRLHKLNYPDNSSVGFSYDSLGRKTSMTDSQGTTSYTYDKLSRLTKIDGPKQNDTLQYAYDELGNRTSLTLPDGKTITHAYDALNRISSITDSNNKSTTYSYDEIGNPVSITYPNNTQATYTFDALHRLTHLSNQNQTTQAKLSEFIYTYDSIGRRLRVESLDGITDYTYDTLGELTQESKQGLAPEGGLSPQGTDPAYSITYEYDSSSNRTRMLKNQTEHLYTYNSLNQLTEEDITGPNQMPITVTGTVTDANGIKSLTVNATNATLAGNNFTAQLNLSPGSNTITTIATDNAANASTKTLNVFYSQTEQTLYLYDPNGNLIKKQSSTQELNLSYDYENRLTQGLSPQGTDPDFLYTYDGEGKRISATHNSTTTNYLYDGLDVILETNSSGDPVTSYLRNPYAAGGIGGIISSQGLSPFVSSQGLKGTDPEVYYSYDGLGSVSNLSDTSGINIQSYTYDAFGNAQGLIPKGTDPNTHQFLTKELDPSGLIFFGARYYEPSISRFITPDPLGILDGPNLYIYASNDPVNLVDTNGLYTLIIHGINAFGFNKAGYSGALGKALESNGETIKEVIWSGNLFDPEAIKQIENEIRQAAMVSASNSENLNIIGHSWGGFLAGSALNETGIKANLVTLGAPYFGQPANVDKYINFTASEDFIGWLALFNLSAEHRSAFNIEPGIAGFHNYWNNAYVIGVILKELGLKKGCRK